MTHKQPQPGKGRAAFHLFQLDALATKVIADMTREAVALREQAAATADETERNELRYEAEGVYHEAQRVIEETYGSTRKAEEVESMVYAAMSAIVMPDATEAIDYGCDGWD